MRLIALLAVFAACLPAQDALLDLSGWRAHDGDDARWAAPEFDDSTWTRVDPMFPEIRSVFGPMLQQQFTWYRTSLYSPAWWAGRDLEIGLRLDDAYEIFVEGVRIGGDGSIHDNGRGATAFTPQTRSFDIPARLFRGNPLHIAIRRWRPPVSNSFQVHSLGLGRGAFLKAGVAPVVRQGVELANIRSRLTAAPTHAMWIVTILSGLFCLFVRRPGGSHQELLWLGLALLASGGLYAISVPLNLTTWLPKTSLLTFAYTFAGFFGSAFFFGWFLAELFPAWRRAIRWTSFPIALGSAFWVVHVWFPFAPASGLLRTLSFSSQMAIGVAAAFVAWRTRQNSLIAPILAIVVRDAAYMMGTISNNLNFLRLGSGSFVLSLRTASDAVIGVALVALLYTRMRREQARQREMSEDFEAARRVQEMLLAAPDAGDGEFRIDTVCLAAREVGGDFYQVIDRPGGERILLVGDVSGKGLRAAMLVSVIVGALRREKSCSPAAILEGLNDALVGQTEGGFVTCTCILFAPGGHARVSNAGHLAPYLDGREVDVEAGLPLGVVGGAAYNEKRIELNPESRITIVSDGVVEAANAKGELFGFERTGEISTRSAHEIATAAKAWGQNDDITVVTVRRSA